MIAGVRQATGPVVKKNSRYVARYFCSLDNPEATKTWFLIDLRTGVPVFEDGVLRLFDRKEVDAFQSQTEDR